MEDRFSDGNIGKKKDEVRKKLIVKLQKMKQDAAKERQRKENEKIERTREERRLKRMKQKSEMVSKETSRNTHIFNNSECVAPSTSTEIPSSSDGSRTQTPQPNRTKRKTVPSSQSSICSTPKTGRGSAQSPTQRKMKQKNKLVLNIKNLEEKRIKERDKKRRQREKMKQDPEAREKFRQKEREIYAKKKESGKVKPINQLSNRAQRQKRMEWRQRQVKHRRKLLEEKRLDNFMENNSLTPSSGVSPTTQQVLNSSRKTSGRKKIRRDKAQAYRNLNSARTESKKYKAKYEKIRKQMQRLKVKNEILSPRSKVRTILKCPKQIIERKLLFGEALVSDLKEKAKTCVTEKEKRSLSSILSGKILKKYRLVKETRVFLNARQRLNIGTARLKRKTRCSKTSDEVVDAVHKFLKQDNISIMTPGKKEFITVKKLKKKKDTCQIQWKTCTRSTTNQVQLN